MATQQRRIGRPPRVAGGQTHIGFQAPANLRVQLEAAAAENRRSLSSETIARLERSFVVDQVLPAEMRNLALRLVSTYLDAGDTGLLRLILLELEPDPKKRETRRLIMMSRLMDLNPDNPDLLKSGFISAEEADRPLDDVLREKLTATRAQPEAPVETKKPARRRRA